MSDDVISDAEIDHTNRMADVLVDNLLEEVEDTEADFAGVIYGIWVSLTRHLAECGWTSEQLARDAAWHAADQSAEGRG